MLNSAAQAFPPGPCPTVPPPPLGQWWQSFFNASEDAHLVCRADGTVVQINPKAVRLLRLPEQHEEDGFSVFKVLSSPAAKKLGELLATAHPHSDTLHSVVTKFAGIPRGLVDLVITPLGGDYSLLTLKDASHRLRLEAHVQRLVTAIDATPEVVFLTDADFHITFVNPAFHAATGHSLEAVLGRTDEFLRAPGEQDKVRAYLAGVGQGREWLGELVNLRQDGTTYHVEATISPICDIAGRLIGYVSCERDITARKQLENDLRLQHDFVRSILQSLGSAIYSLDAEFRLTHANEGWRQMPAKHAGIRLNGPPEIGKCLLDCVPDAARRDQLRQTFQQVLTGGKTEENRFAAPDGHHWLVRVSPWHFDGSVRGLICNITDETQFQELQDQLFQAQKMEIIGTLAAGVAHDFNNLLQVIRGNNGLVLLQLPADSTLRPYAEQVNLATFRAADITKQLLSFSRDSKEKDTVLDLNEVVDEAAHLVRRSLRGHINLEIKLGPGPLPIRVDSTRCNQALLNLCVNAQDAMPDGGQITIRSEALRLTREQAEGHGGALDQEFARCSVTDTGTGIPRELLQRIFDPFFTTKEKGKGTGLGLAIVKRVVEEAGGFLEVESVPGRGTTFHLFLPIAHEALTAQPAPVQEGINYGAGRVLVVEDMDLLREFNRSFLQTAGMTVLTAANGREALDLLERETEPVDLLFTDFSMPGMNGIELIEQVAARWPKMRRVLASGCLDGPAQLRLAELEVNVISKPYEMRHTADTLIKLLPVRKA